MQEKPPVTEATRQQLVQKRDEIKSQLEELTDRRRELQSQRDQMNPVSGRGHEARMAVIDQRSAALETELFAVNDQLRSVSAQLGGSPEADGGNFTTTEPDLIADMARRAVEDAVFGSFAAATFSLLGIYVLWRGVRRWVWKPKRPALADTSAQIMQLQHSMDAMAIEIERISEAQRFSARLLNDRVLSQGEAEPMGAAQRESVGARKRS